MIEIEDDKMMVQPPAGEENEILFCVSCGSTDFYEHTIAYEADIYESEKEVICSNCNNITNYWAYGFYDNYKSDEYLHKEKQLLRKEKFKKLK
jgi:hypothetical protein